MKGLKKFTAIVVAIAMVAGLSAVNPGKVSAAVKIQSGKKMTIVVGKTDKIYVKQKGAKFSTSNKKIATVSSSGKVKAKKAGTCKITVKVGSSSAKCTVKVVPANVKVSSVVLTSQTSAKVTWKAAKGASGYYIYTATKKNGKYKKVKTVKGAKKKSATVSNLPMGYNVYFKVKAYAKSGKKTLLSESYSKASDQLSVKTWKLEWSDEFNGNSLDTSVWTYETGATGWGNQEPQEYTAGKNIKFENGNLVIIPRMEISSSGTKYTSTRIKTAGKKEFTYGKMEIRAKSAKGQGTWSAGWMLGSTGGTWPACGEIDILEAMNGGVPQTIHCPYFNNSSNSHGNKYYTTGLTQAQCASAYHSYAAEWTDTYIKFSVDGREVGTYDPTMYSPTIYNQCWVFNHPFFFILNCAIGGNAAGQISTKDWNLVSNSGGVQTWEDYYYIDYVRVYK